MTHRTWQLPVATARLRDALSLDTRSDVGPRLEGMAVVARDSSGRATRIELRGAAIRRLSGESFRAVLNRSFGDRAVQSTRFTVERRGSSYVISGSGFGHGVGLCQVGAAARLRRGDPVDVVLAAYFPGASVTRLRPGTLMPDTRGRGQTTASLLELR